MTQVAERIRTPRTAGSAGHRAGLGYLLDPPESAHHYHSVRYHVPRSVLASRCETQTSPVDKFGGLPWGFGGRNRAGPLQRLLRRQPVQRAASRGAARRRTSGDQTWWTSALAAIVRGGPTVAVALCAAASRSPDGQVGDGSAPTAEETGWGVQRNTPNGPEYEYPSGTPSHDHVRVRVAVLPDTWWVLGPNFGMAWRSCS